MKYLYLIRHAKSSWDNPGLTDIKRPLSNRGKQDAPMMGKRLAAMGTKPDLLITSPAKRARKTAKKIAKKTGYPAHKIIIDNNLYLKGVINLLKTINEINEKYNTVFLFGHNPDFTSLANLLTHAQLYNIPTCGICCIAFDIGSWQFVKEGNGKLILYDYPKKFSR